MESINTERQEVSRVLNFWWTLESLNFAEVPKLSAERNVRVVRSDAEWPWKTGKYRPSRRGDNLYTWRHEVYLGVALSRRLVKETFDVFQEQIPDIGGRLPKGYTALAALVVDDSGAIALADEERTAAPPDLGAPTVPSAPRIAPDMITFSTLPWALARLAALANGRAWEGALFSELCEDAVDDIETRFATAKPTDSAKLVLTLERAKAILDSWLFVTGWKGRWEELIRVRSIEVRVRNGDASPPKAPILNSFYLEDISRVMAAVQAGAIGSGLRHYLHAPIMPAPEVALRKNVRTAEHAEHWLHPTKWPCGAWPHKGGHSLVYAQQCAVNAIWGELGAADGDGVFAVNGPPGTGKTTLLADLVAAVVTQRAEALAKLPHARAAFKNREAITDKLGVFPLIEDLIGHEIVVASANNGAVENVTRELPALKKIEAAWFSPLAQTDYRYFPEIARAALNPPPKTNNAADDESGDEEPEADEAIEAWGLVAAVLGNSRNKDAFTKTLWYSKDAKSGFREYMDAEYRSAGANAEKKFTEAQARFERSRAAVALLQEKAECCAAAVKELANVQVELATGKAKLGELTRELAVAQQSRAKRVADEMAFRERFGRAQALWQAAEATATWLRQRNIAVDAKRRLDDAKATASIKEKKKHDASVQLTQQRDAAEQRRTLRMLHGERKPVFWMFWLRRPAAVRWEVEAEGMDRGLGEAFRDLEQAVAKAASVDEQHRESERAVSECELAQRSADDIASELWKKTDTAFAKVPADAPLRRLFRRHENFRTELEREHAACTSELNESERLLTEVKKELSNTERVVRALQANIDGLNVKCRDLTAHAPAARTNLDTTKAGRTVIDEDFRNITYEEQAQRSPWIDEEWRKARITLFLDALALHKAFLLAAWKPMHANLNLATELLSGRLPPKAASHLHSLWASVFLVTPVVSTTFASLDRLFRGMGRGSLGWLVVDEAGQATPQMAVGGLWRARRAVIVGDPYQLQPVVTLPKKLVELLRAQWQVRPSYVPGEVSVQRLADSATMWGAPFGVHDLWVGCPLVVHRRCLQPMFGVANEIAYGRMMVYGTKPDKDFVPLFGASGWVHIDARATFENWIEEEGRLAVEMAQQAWRLGEQKSLFFITPFRSVADELRKMLTESLGDEAEAWIKRSVGTVHTFQGKENANVVILLGGDPGKPGVRAFAADEPNLLNVALTRAKSRLYVIGNVHFWTEKEFFKILAENIKQTPFAGILTPERFRASWRPLPIQTLAHS
ncbi:MAG: AAA domain-containing protein [Opitutaceae bacterium]|jgi:hypothetical protein